jgi:hypothetical protein
MTMGMLWFYCDESADAPQHKPKNYCVAGLLGEERTFAKLERAWVRINTKVGVKRYHASPLNARDGEFSGWTSERSIEYSKRLLDVLKKRGPGLQVTSMGIHADAYRNIFSEGAQDRFGHPYIACFKGCLAMIALQMSNLPADWKFSVIFERNKELNEAIVRSFYLLKEMDSDIGPRMGTCTPGQWDENIALQAADLVAYESMRLLKNKRKDQVKMRHAFKSLTGVSGFRGYYLDKDMLENMREAAEAATCLPGGWFPISRQWYPDYVDGDSWEDIENKNGITRYNQ